MLTITLENAMSYIGIFTFCMAIMNYMVIVPFDKSIKDLRATIESMDEDCRRRSERLVLVEASTKQAHKRLDDMSVEVHCLRNELIKND